MFIFDNIKIVNIELSAGYRVGVSHIAVLFLFLFLFQIQNFLKKKQRTRKDYFVKGLHCRRYQISYIAA